MSGWFGVFLDCIGLVWGRLVGGLGVLIGGIKLVWVCFVFFCCFFWGEGGSILLVWVVSGTFGVVWDGKWMVWNGEVWGGLG